MPMLDYTLPLEELPDPLPIVPLEKPFDVTITPPGSKSITNRAYVLAALAEGESRIIRPLRAEDTDSLLNALCTLGAEARWEGDDALIRGVGGRFPRGGEVYLGDGGTPTRFMIACACLAAEPVVVDASPRMRERPIAEGVEMLRQLGARIEYVEEEGRLPVRVTPSERFKGGELTVGKTASSQFVSAVMLIAPWLNDTLRLHVTEPLTSPLYVALTEGVMRDWHIQSFEDSDPDRGPYMSLWVEPGSVSPQQYSIEPDASSAVYWIAAAALVRGSHVRIPNLRLASPQPDVRFAGVMEELGGRVHWSSDNGDVAFSHRLPLRHGHSDAGDMPDAAMSLAVACAVADGLSTITGLHTLRVKETDRIAALANELRKVGCTVETADDSITITPPPGTAALRAASHDSENRGTHPVVIETYNDHRMAMSFAILGLVRPGIFIRNPKCVAKSYPTFWKDFAKLYQ
jgi:3-phosphoshikimate 1-carboxyvinyltransferase